MGRIEKKIEELMKKCQSRSMHAEIEKIMNDNGQRDTVSEQVKGDNNMSEQGMLIQRQFIQK